jgi:ribosomal protein L40E
VEKHCAKCGAANPEAAKFCRGCGTPLPAAPPVIAAPAQFTCPTCSAVNPVGARFCKHCGGGLGQLAPSQAAPTPSAPVLAPLVAAVSETPAPIAQTGTSAAAVADPVDFDLDAVSGSRPANSQAQASPSLPSKVSRKLILGIVGAVVAFSAMSGGGYYWYRADQQHKAAEAESKRQEAEARHQLEVQRAAELDAARARAEQAERTAKEAELRAAQAAAEAAQAQARAAEQANREAQARAAQERAAREAQVRSAQDRANREAQARVQAEQDAARARALASQRQPVQRYEQTPAAFCATKSNFISRAICEQRECQKPVYFNTGYCQAVRQRSTTNQ